MCGIAGFMTVGGATREGSPADVALSMADTLAHRGPDGRAAWGDPEAGIGLGHRRLAIVDLSPTGAQPMHSADGRYVIVYNGEVYNFPELRAELLSLGHRFSGTSDTEVMLAACVQWGPKDAVRRFVGMFAFALFDRKTRTLFLVRDRLGVKPLYWTIADGTLLFGSELRALAAHPAFRPEVDRDAVAAQVRYSYVPAPATIYRGVFKLPPACVLSIRHGETHRIERYWQIPGEAIGSGQAISFEAAAHQLDALLRDSVRGRMIADVPVGAFLSGGFDSSTVVALMQNVSNRAARTFTVGFGNGVYDETAHARDIARHLQTDHTEMRLEAGAALGLVQRIPDWFDEPFGDSSQLPTYLVSQMTRQHVTVSLSGDGGDELFAGYPKYAFLDRTWRYAGQLPRYLRSLGGRLLAAAPQGFLEFGAARIFESGRAERIGEKTRRLAWALSAQNGDEAARRLAAVGLRDGVVLDANGAIQPRDYDGPQPDDLVSRMQLQDLSDYLPDDILTKVDRCSMAVSLEAREPLLDHRVVEFIWSLPEPIRHGKGRYKGLLRAVLDRYVPPALTDRPKRGFSVPLADWLKGPLHEWASDLLSPSRLSAAGLFDVSAITPLWQKHVAGVEDNATGLWNVIMVQAWAQRWRPTA